MNRTNVRRAILLLATLGLPASPVLEQVRCGELDLSSGQRYLLLATERTATMQDELNQAAARGYRIVQGSHIGGSELGIVLELVAEPEEDFEYYLLATNRLSTMEHELNQIGRLGFRVVPRAVFVEECDCGELIAVAQRSGREGPGWEYRVLGTERTSSLNREINQASGEGYDLTALVRKSENVAVMERELRH